MSAVSRVSDELVTLFNSTPFGVSIVAERGYRIEREIRFSGIRITITPDTLSVTLADVSRRKNFDWRIAVWVQAITSGSVADVDPLMDLIEDIASLVAGRAFEQNFARCIGVETIPPVDPEKLATKGLFLSGLFLTFRVPKA